MLKNKFIFISVLMVAFLAMASGAQAAHWIAGTVNDATDGTPADGHTVIIYYPGDEAHNESDLIGPASKNGASSNHYLLDAEFIPGHVWKTGDVIYVKVIDNGDGYTAGPVSITTTGAGFDYPPDMTLQAPIMADAGPDQTVDEDVIVYFNGSGSTGALNYSWDFDASDGIQEDATGINVSHVYAQPGIYTVTLTINAGASDDTLVVTVNDITPPTANAGPDQTVINGTLAEFNGTLSTDNVAIVNYSWDFDASDGIQSDATGAVVSHLYPTFGTYTATLTVCDAAGNNATDTVNITVTEVRADAGPDQTVDEDTTVYLDASNSTGALNYSWDFDASDGIQEDATGVNVSYIYTEPGVYTVTLTINAGASNDTLVVTVNDITPPTANAGPDQNVLNGTFVQFNGTLSTDNVAIVNYSWDFDANDGIQQDATGAVVTHLYPTFGIYTATLTVCDAAGNNATDTVNITVAAIIADAGPDQTVNEDVIVYFNGSNSSGAVNYSWDFDASNGIQQDATEVNVSYVYAQPGVYTVTLTINAGASNDTLVVTVKDVTPPTANAGSNQIVLNGTFVQFNGTLSTDNVAIVNYSWDFDASNGIQQDATGVTASHLYPAFGTYTATLTVCDAAGNNATDTVNVSVVPSIAPIGLTVVLNADKTVTLSWVESLLGNFDIYASNTSGVSLVTPIATGYGYSWTDNDADAYSHRYYKVRAKGVVGSETIAKYDVNLVKKPGCTGKNWISMPENPAITNASSLMKAIGPTCDSINRWNPVTQRPEGWISLMGGMGTNFAVTPYEGYEVSVNANTTFTVVGIMGY